MTKEDAPLKTGQSASMEIEITNDLIDRFAALSGDNNPLHMSSEYGVDHGFKGRVAHGAIALSFISNLVGTRLPGPGALWRGIQLDWVAPLYPGDVLHLETTVQQVSISADSLGLLIEGKNQNGTRVLRGSATVSLSTTVPSAEVYSGAPQLAANEIITTSGRAERPVLVTGGSRGIGRAIAIHLARLGHPVALTYRANVAAANEVTSQIILEGGQAIAFEFDAASPNSASRVVEQVREQFGRVLCLVHAGSPALRYTSVEEDATEYLEQLLRVYVGSGLTLAQAIIPDCKACRWGRLIYIGSSRLFGPPPPDISVYVTAKMGLWGLTRSLASELGRFGITCNMVSPGLTDTELVADLSRREKLLEAQRTPMRRLAEPDDAARFIGFLTGDESSFVTGSNLPITGGFTMA